MGTDVVMYPAKGYPWIEKGVKARLDYIFDWTDWTTCNGDTILSATAEILTADGEETVPGPGIPEVVAVLVTDNGTKVQVVVDGGTVGLTFLIRCMPVTTNTPARKPTKILALRIRL